MASGSTLPAQTRTEWTAFLCLSFYLQEPQRLTPERVPQPRPGPHPSPTSGADSGTLCLSLSRPLLSRCWGAEPLLLPSQHLITGEDVSRV